MSALRSFVASCFAACLANAAEPLLQTDLGGGIKLDMVLVRAGGFLQGSPVDEPGRAADEAQRAVQITRDFYIGKTAVTRSQWERFVAETGHRSEAETGTSGGFGWDGQALVQRKSFTWRQPGFPQAGDHPVCMVTFPDAQTFCAWLERKTKRGTTLPTEAQWEYACRAGTTTPWHAGADGVSNAWHKGNAGNGTRPVGSSDPNAWGLIIGGNVSEWCLDWYAPYQAGAAADPRQDNPNLSDKPRRVLRGGSWLRDGKNTRSAARYRVDPRSRNADIGFRIVCATEVAAPPPPPKPAAVAPAPKVEAEPGDLPPPEPEHRAPPPPVRRDWPVSDSFFEGLGGLLCMLIPIGLIITFIRLIASHGKRANHPLEIPPPPPVMRPPVRKVNDGFWIHGDWPVGTALRLHYVAGGVAEDLDLIYRPGPEGQFVFTGTSPDSVNVVADGGDPVPPPLFAGGAVTSLGNEDQRPAAPRPPLFPPAY